MASATATRWWHQETGSDGRPKVVCTLCPRECHIPAGSRGFCFVRANQNDRMVLTTYGRSSGFCIDPIEKKPLHHFLPGTPVLSFGTAGCNLGCKFCQNWDISKSREWDTLALAASPEAIVRTALQHRCRSLAFTYNDPVIWAEYAIDVAQAARARGIRTVAVTAGYIHPDARADFFAPMEAANVDLKGFTQDFYRKLCQGQLQPVLDTLHYLHHQTQVWLEITTLLIPGENDQPHELRALCDWVATHLGVDVPLHFTAFHPDFKLLDKPRTPLRTLQMARGIALEAGLRYVYIGNIHDAAGSTTFCPACRRGVIVREGYHLAEWHLNAGCCMYCGTAIPGHFEDVPGTWGPRREPVQVL